MAILKNANSPQKISTQTCKERWKIKYTAIEKEDEICLGTKIFMMAWNDAATKIAHKGGGEITGKVLAHLPKQQSTTEIRNKINHNLD